jgi:hypothetical protein
MTDFSFSCLFKIVKVSSAKNSRVASKIDILFGSPNVLYNSNIL